MPKIYKDNKNRLFLLEEHLTLGNKVCLVPFSNAEDKFVAPSTLKRNYTLLIEKDYIVEVVSFTGMKLGLFVPVVTPTERTCFKKNHTIMSFTRTEDTQTNAKNPKFANKIYREFGNPVFAENSQVPLVR